MKIVHTLVFTALVVIFHSIELSTQSDGSSSSFGRPVPSGSSLRPPLQGPPDHRRTGEHSGVSSNHSESSTPRFRHLPEGSGRKQFSTLTHPRFPTPHADDILLPLALEKWPLLAETLKKDWPANLEYYYFVKTAIKWRSKEPNLLHTIYCPGGDHNSGIFVAISSFAVYHVIIFAHEGFEKLLHKAVIETKIIKWTEGVRFYAISSRMISTLDSIIETLKQTMGLEVEWSLPGNTFFKPKEESAAVKVRVPEGCYLKAINQSDVPLIHSLWARRNQADPEMTMNLLMTRLRLSGGLGLYSKENNELLSWVLQGEFGEGAVGGTIEKARRKGYVNVLGCTLDKELAANGYDSFRFVARGNLVSEKLMKSVNFSVHQPYVLIQIKKLRNRL